MGPLDEVQVVHGTTASMHVLTPMQQLLNHAARHPPPVFARSQGNRVTDALVHVRAPRVPLSSRPLTTRSGHQAAHRQLRVSQDITNYVPNLPPRFRNRVGGRRRQNNPPITDESGPASRRNMASQAGGTF